MSTKPRSISAAESDAILELAEASRYVLKLARADTNPSGVATLRQHDFDRLDRALSRYEDAQW